MWLLLLLFAITLGRLLRFARDRVLTPPIVVAFKMGAGAGVVFSANHWRKRLMPSQLR